MNDTPVCVFRSDQDASGSDPSSLFFAGDFALAEVNKSKDPGKLISGPVRKQIRDSDFAVINYEGVTSSEGDPILKGGPVVEIDQACPRLLSDFGFDVATLANNHILDLGTEGLTQTVEFCQKSGLKTVGVGDNRREALKPLRVSTDSGVEVSIFNFSERPIHEYQIDRSGPSLAEITDPKLTQFISEEREKSDVLIGVSHAGEIGTPIPPIQLQRRYHDLVDIGLDLVVGHHPHVPQGWEQYNDGTIFYSLGNFLFDYGQADRPKQNWGLTLRVSVDDIGLRSIEIIPVETVDRRVSYLGRKRNLDTSLKRLEQMSSAVSDEDRLSKMWLVIAEQLLIKRKSDYQVDSERFLNRMVWDSHRHTTETGLIKHATSVDVSDEVVEETLRMWSWTGNVPAQTTSSKMLEKMVHSIYQGPVRRVSKQAGIHQRLRNSYCQVRSYLNENANN